LKNIHDMMKNLQQATDRLNKLNLNHSNPWQSITQMQDMFGQDFWSQFKDLTRMDTEMAVHSSPVKNKPDKFVPLIDVFNTLRRVIVCCQLPGLDRNSLKVSVRNGDQLIIQGMIKEHHLSDYRIAKERFEGKFSRQIELPCAVSSESVKTSYKDGILELYLTKKKNLERQKSDENDVDIDI
jgi:HSP20 family protein